MRVLFCNTHERACGVNQYGSNLYAVLCDSERIHWDYYGGASAPPMGTLKRFDVIVYNWQGLIGGWMSAAPIQHMGKQVLVYHDLDILSHQWDAILFSDPTMQAHDNWHPIGRPIPHYVPIINPIMNRGPTVGVHGFCGAWANQVVQRVIQEFEYGLVRLHLPYSRFCDPNGDQARSMAETCRGMTSGTGINLEVSHDFLPQRELLDWLARNDVNAYMRNVGVPWRGVSSALDVALAARKPIAIDKCSGFRHLFGASPSICVEDSSFTEIICNGLSPLVPFYKAWSPENIRSQVEAVLYSVVNKA